MDGRPLRRVDTPDRTQWLTLSATCLGVLMMALDSTVVNVALPSIQSDLSVTESSLVWIVNGYFIPYGGFLPACGRLGDYYGHRRIFLLGIAVFTLASFGCGIAGSLTLLVSARVVQGIAAAAISAVSLSLTVHEFTEPTVRARALAIYSCVSSCGASAGLFLGGILTSALNWRWIFLINLPLGALVYLLCQGVQIRSDRRQKDAPLDFWGAATITTSLALVIYAVLNTSIAGWGSAYVVAPLGGGLVCFALFLVIESRSRDPILPFDLFNHHNLRIMVIAGCLWSAAQNAWFFISALDLGHLLGHDAFRVGLAFLPATLLMSALSLGLSTKLVTRFGARPPLTAGLVCIAAALVLQSRAPVDANFMRDIFPSMLLIGLGVGIANSPYLLSALTGLKEDTYGLVSGLLNGSRVLAGTFGIASIASIAAARSSHLLGTGMRMPMALHSGYNLAYILSAASTLSAALVSLSHRRMTHRPQGERFHS